MGICQVCNGLVKYIFTCPKCQRSLEEKGRLMDDYDDYSAYMEIDLLKLEDGFPNNFIQKTCAHIYHCATCRYEEIHFFQE